jgi:hypothetical protein
LHPLSGCDVEAQLRYHTTTQTLHTKRANNSHISTCSNSPTSNVCRMTCTVVLTLFRCPLACASQSCSCIVVAVSPDCLDRHGSERLSLRVLVQFSVVDRKVLTVAATNWCGDILVRLCSRERTWSAGYWSSCQRQRCTIPAVIPRPDGAWSASYPVALCKSQEATTACVARVLCEDVMLEVGAVANHGWLHGRWSSE